MENLLPKPREMDFNAQNLADGKMEPEHGVLLNCSGAGKGRRRKIQCAPVFNWWTRKRCVQHNDMGEERKCWG